MDSSSERSESAQLVENSPVQDKKNTLRTIAGYVAVTLQLLFITISLSCVQALGKIIPGFELNAWRFGVQFLWVMPTVAVMKLDVRVKREATLYTCIAVLAYNTALFTFYETAKFLPAGAEGCLLPTLTLMMTAPVSAILTKRCRLDTMAAIVLCVAGSVLYIQPAFIFGGDSTAYAMNPLCGNDAAFSEELASNGSGTVNASENLVHLSSNRSDEHPATGKAMSQRDVILGYVYVFAAAISFSIVILVTNQKLGDVHPLVISFWAGLSSTVVSVVAMLIFETPVFPADAVCIVLLLAHSITGGVCQVLQLVAIALLEPVVYVLMQTLTTMFFCISQYTALRDISPPRGNAFEIVGAITVVLGNALGPVYAMCKHVKEETKTETSDMELSSVSVGNQNE